MIFRFLSFVPHFPLHSPTALQSQSLADRPPPDGATLRRGGGGGGGGGGGKRAGRVE